MTAPEHLMSAGIDDWALWWRSLPGLVSAATTVIFLDAKARSEEERLRARFLDYQGYAKRVKRLVPWIY